MISETTIKSFLRQLHEKVYEDEHLDCVFQTQIDKLEGIKLPRNVKPRELVIKAASSGYIEYETAADGFINIHLTDKGIIYFEERKKARKARLVIWLPIIIAFLTLIASVIAILTQRSQR